MSERSFRVPSLLKRLGTSIATIIVLLLILEAGFRLFYHDDAMEFDHDATLYWYSRPGQKTSQVSINSLGLRGPETKEKDPSRFRFLATGDSFTFGYGVTNAESWPLQLGALLDREGARHPGDGRPIEVLNGGGPGWGVFQMERYLRRAIPRFEPDVVMLVVTPIDIYRQPFREEADVQAFLKQKEKRRVLREASVFLTFMVRRVNRLELGSRAVPNERAADKDLEPLWAVDSARIRGLVTDFKGKTRFVLGVMWDFSKIHDWIAEHVLALARELGVDAIDVGPLFAGADQRDVTVPGDGHPNGKAHARTARAMADLLYSRDLAVRPSSGTIEAREP